MSERTSKLPGKRRLVTAGLTVVGLSGVIALLAVMFMTFNARPAYGSGSGGGGCYSTTGPTCTFKGHQAYVDYSSVSADGCIYTDASVQPFESFTTPGHTAMQSVMVFFSKYDACNNTLIEGASNLDPSTGLAVFNGTAQFGSGLSTATVNGTATLFDFNTGAQLGTSTVNLTWNGYGPTSTFFDNSHYRSVGFFMNTHFTGSSRSAEVTGVFTDTTGANIATQPSLYAEMTNSSGGTVMMSRS